MYSSDAWSNQCDSGVLPSPAAAPLLLGISVQLLSVLCLSTLALRFEFDKSLLAQLTLEALGLQLDQLALLCLDLLIQLVQLLVKLRVLDETVVRSFEPPERRAVIGSFVRTVLLALSVRVHIEHELAVCAANL